MAFSENLNFNYEFLFTKSIFKIRLSKDFGHNVPFYYGAVVGTGEVRGTIKKEKVGS